MKGLREFIVKIDRKFKDKYVSDGGLEVYGDRRWSAKRLASTRVKVVSVPMIYEGEIEPGYDLFVDPSIVFSQMYQKTGEHESQWLVDRKKNLYRAPDNMIIAYTNGDDNLWNAYKDNVLVVREEKKEEIKSDLVIPEYAKKKVRGMGRVLLAPEQAEVSFGDMVLFDELKAVDTYLDGQPCVWLREKDLLALVEETT